MPVNFIYSNNDGDSIVTTEVGPAVGDFGGDLDDFNLGVAIAAANKSIYYSASYTGAFSELSGLTGLDGTALITCVRVPYRKLATQALNDDKTSLQFIFATGSAVSGKTLWGVTFNATDGTILAQSDMTPIISSTTYRVIGPEALETNGQNTQRILALAKPLAGGNTRLIYSSDGGATWSIRQSNLDARCVRWVEGSLTRAVISGAVGIRYSENMGGTVANRDGDFEIDIADFPAEGAYLIGQLS